ncbi:Hsp20/alpha crystallin family protein [Terrimonas sp. NA20]|uniref:Hsp20/alpha crystallin family protein n=1 Tax=Terrimonas ginsenosidimutans TaxID=2908004 RepID=A0ABS9KVE5_9BACT|nr:Hsp20/alpha crystallin family protein [Terrimonas ginsenosidimutans]MCG2616293.1 Hsp20/alpha crystallin family protein [Terrimonas ginsenosidimutans]
MNMQTSFDGCCSYPGWYIPTAGSENLLKQLSRVRRQKFTNLPYSIQEYDHHYKVEVTAHASNKDEVLLYFHAGELIVAFREKGNGKQKQDRLRTGNYFIAEILLPDTADIAFSSAEYRQGTLEICISKGVAKKQQADQQIVVY